MEDIGLHHPQTGWPRLPDDRRCDFPSLPRLGGGEDSISSRPVKCRSRDWARRAPCRTSTSPMSKIPGLEAIDITFNSLESSAGGFYLGVWGGRARQNLVGRRAAAAGGTGHLVCRERPPLRATSPGSPASSIASLLRDFHAARDPKVGIIPWPGGFTVWHAPPLITLPAGSRIRDGQTVLLSYYPHRDHRRRSGDVLHGRAETIPAAALADRTGSQASRARRRIPAARRDPCARLGREPPPGPGRRQASFWRRTWPSASYRCAAIILASRFASGRTCSIRTDIAPTDGRYDLVKGDGPWYGSGGASTRMW